jgi:RNA recognition motif-containing protein
MRSSDSQKVIVVGIPKTLDDAQLSDLFGDFGAVAEAKVVLDATSKESRGFGFVTFTAASAMRAAIKGMNRKVVQGRTLNVRQLVPKDQFQAQKQEEPDASQRPCWLLRKGKCLKGAACPFSHDIKDGEFGNCFEFVQTGSCKRGDKCKFSHPQKEDEETETEDEAAEPKKPEKRVCYSFQNGRCHRGKKCLFVHEMLANEEKPGAKKEKKQPFEVVESEAGKKRRRPDESEEGEQVKETQKKAPAAAGLAAHVNSFMSRKQTQEPKQKLAKPNVAPRKFEWKAKVQTKEPDHEREQEQQVEKKEQVQVQQRPMKKMKTERVDMGAAFDGVSDDEAGPKRGGRKQKVDKETMRANREKLKLERRAKRSAKKTALSKLMTKGEVALDA